VRRHERRSGPVGRVVGRTWEKITLPTFPGEGPTPPDVKPPENPKPDPKKADDPKKGAALVSPHIFGMQNSQPKQEPPAPVSPFAAPPKGSALTAVSFTDDGQEGWIAGTHGVLFHSADSGRTWKEIRLGSKDKAGLTNDPNSYHFIAVRAMSNGDTVIADSGGCRITYSLIPNSWVHPLHGTHPTGGAWIESNGLPWLAGDRRDAGRVKRFTAPGTAPIEVVTPPATTHPLHAITRTPDAKAWAVGHFGTIVEVVGGVPKLHELPSKKDVTLRAVAFANPMGVVGGDGPTLAHTADGGTTWKASTLLTPANPAQSVRALWISSDDGWAVGTGGLLLRSADAGATWHSFTRPADAGGSPLFLPAPWLLLALLLAGWCFVRATVPPVLAPVDAIDDSLTPDLPALPPNDPATTFAAAAPAAARHLLWAALAVTLALVVVGVVGVLRAPGVVVRDSTAFTKALAL